MFRFIFCLLLSVAFLSGCGLTAAQKQDVAQFGKATEAMGIFAEDEIIQIRQEVIQMNTTHLILKSDQTSPKIDLDRPTSAESALKRVAAAKALKSYGTLLNQLATADRTEGIKKAAGDVVTNFDAALDTGLSKEEKDAAIGIIVALGNMWIEKEKKDAIKRLVEKYNNGVVKIADLLAEDFNVDGMGYLGGYSDVAGQLESISIKALTQGQHPNFFEREFALRAYVSAEKAKLKAKELAAKAKKSIAALKKANSNLIAVVDNADYTSEDIKSYAKSIQELANLTKILAN